MNVQATGAFSGIRVQFALFCARLIPLEAYS